MRSVRALLVVAVALLSGCAILPRIPEGDVVVVAYDAVGVGRASGDALERLDVLLRQWPVAGLALLVLAVLMGAAMLAGG